MAGAFYYGVVMIESQYTANVHKRLPQHIKAWKINDNYAGGVPDAFYRNNDPAAKTRPFWIEYKFLKALPKRGTTCIIPDLSSLQLNQLKEIEAANNDEKATVIVGVQRVEGITGAAGFEVFPHEWETGISTDEARARCKDYAGICNLISNYTVFYY